jgi:hypothetical protein
VAPSVAASQAYAFADGNSGHVCTFSAGAPAVDEFDLLFVNSDTTVSTPTGFTLAVSAVTNQGAYVFRRKATGGESSSVTITTSGNNDCHVIWVRVAGAAAADVTGSAQANGSAGTSTPAFTSSALAATGEIAFAFAALHSFPSSVPNTLTWAGSYTAVTSGTQGTGSPGVAASVGYKVPAGTAAELPSCSWNNNANDRYILFLSLTAASAVQTISLAGSITPTGTLGKQAGKALSGSTTPTGAMLRQAAKALAGAIAPASALARQADKVLTGAVAPAGSTTRLVGKNLAGTITPTGVVLKLLGRLLAGSTTPTGAISTTAIVPVPSGSMHHASRTAAAASHTGRSGPTMTGR